MNLVASSMRRLSMSMLSSNGVLLLTSPRTTPLFFGTNRSGFKSPARGVSYSSKKWLTSARVKSGSATDS